MPKIAKALGALAVSRLNKVGSHPVGGVAGLMLMIRPNADGTPGAKYWVLRVTVAGQRRNIGLGGYSQTGMGVAQAREAALAMRQRIMAGNDPVHERKTARAALVADRSKAKTFRDCCDAYIAAHEAGWRNAKHAQQWRNTLETHAHPVMGDKIIGSVTLADVLKVLEPIWATKTETASRLRSRVELVLDWATARGLREGENPARWRGHLDKLMPKPTKVAKVEHHPAVKPTDAAAFLRDVRATVGMSAKALEFVTLTACRSGEARGATWREVDMAAKVWTIPAGRTKAHREHRVPLSDDAIKLLKSLRPEGTDTKVADLLVFPSTQGKELSDMALSMMMRRLDYKDVHGKTCVVHGLRSSFRVWAGEFTSHPREVCEHALAHRIGDAAERAYSRGDLFARRAVLMSDWAKFLNAPAVADNVVEFKAVKA